MTVCLPEAFIDVLSTPFMARIGDSLFYSAADAAVIQEQTEAAPAFLDEC